MSKQGMKIMADVFLHLQQKRGELLALGATKAGTKEGNQDLRLASLCEDMKEATKDKFTKLTLED
jgi:hypothetical protein